MYVHSLAQPSHSYTRFSFQIHGRRPDISKDVFKVLDSDPRVGDSIAETPDEKMKITVAETKGNIYEIETTLPPLL